MSFSPNPAKRAVEVAWLVYTPVWGAAAGLVMLTGLAERWGDGPLLAFGLVLALGALLAPMLNASGDERARPLRARTSARMSLGIVLLAFGLNYFQTPYFFDVLHMRYGFHATWAIDRNPVFLYLLTIPYFATYSVLACVAVRVVQQRASTWPRVLRWVAIAIVPFLLALLETLLNANPWMRALFCYDDTPLMLWFGTLSYGVAFVLVLPIWVTLDEERGASRATLGRVALLVLIVVGLDAVVLFGLRAVVAPHLTEVVAHASGGREPGGCLEETAR